MRNFLTDGLHVFIIVMIAAFVIGGILAVTGTFDHWGSRYILKRRRKRLMRNRRTEIRNNNTQEVPNNKPYYAPKPQRNPVNYNGGYA